MDERTITIPASVDELAERLNGIDRLLVAKEWERAAIVYAFTRNGQGERGDSTTSTTISRSLTFTAFAALGINGLRDPQTVARYRTRWMQAIEHGDAEAVRPGDVVVLPARTWKPFTSSNDDDDTSTAAKATRARRLLADPVVVAEIKDDIVDVVASSPHLTTQTILSAASKRRITPAPDADVSPVHALFGIGAATIERVKLIAPAIRSLVDALRTDRVDVDAASLGSLVSDLRQAAQQLHDYADAVERAAGITSTPSSTDWIDRLEPRE
jgi:hypothetical protein